MKTARQASFSAAGHEEHAVFRFDPKRKFLAVLGVVGGLGLGAAAFHAWTIGNPNHPLPVAFCAIAFAILCVALGWTVTGHVALGPDALEIRRPLRIHRLPYDGIERFESYAGPDRTIVIHMVQGRVRLSSLADAAGFGEALARAVPRAAPPRQHALPFTVRTTYVLHGVLAIVVVLTTLALVWPGLGRESLAPWLAVIPAALALLVLVIPLRWRFGPSEVTVEFPLWKRRYPAAALATVAVEQTSVQGLDTLDLVLRFGTRSVRLPGAAMVASAELLYDDVLRWYPHVRGMEGS